MADDESIEKLDPELVNSFLGKSVLVGITYCDPDGTAREQHQFFGRISSITEAGITLKHPDTGEEFSLPPDLSNYTRAEPGEYRLRSTGEVVIDPDFLTTWNCISPPPDDLD